jgi:hypothetical protein
MRVTLDDGLRALRESAELARSIRVELDDDYLRHIAEVEAMPANQSASNKTWVWNAEDAFREHYRNARQV